MAVAQIGLVQGVSIIRGFDVVGRISVGLSARSDIK